MDDATWEQRRLHDPEGGSAPPLGPTLPREIVLASAGTGKTFRLSSRIIGLLNAGVPAQEILASTFTRKAAGEILERVLIRLARAVVEEKERTALAVHAGLPGAPVLDPARVEALLTQAVEALHRMNVSTLDAFFHRVARAFSLEMGLAPGWEVADTADGEALATAAVDRLLADADRGEMGELLRLHRAGDVGRGVHAELLAVVEGIQRVARELDPREPHPWGFTSGADEGPPARSELEALARRVGEAELPLTKKGTPDSRWSGAAQAHQADLRNRDWKGLLGRGIFAAVFSGKEAFSRHEISSEWEGLAREAGRLARRDLLPGLQGRAQALGRLAEGFEAAFVAEQNRRSLYRFEDIPHLLLSTGTTERGGEIYFRLDGRIRHLLLDEFQDTSALQWRALEPLAEEILQGHEGERAVVVVADPKQSIYGWRGGEPRLLERISRRSGIPTDALKKSYRSSPVILDAVNRICARFPASPVLDQEHEDMAAREWARDFPHHEAAFPDLPGFLRVVQSPPEEGRRQLRPGVVAAAADEVHRLHRTAPGATVGVLCRTGKAVNRMIWELRRREIPVSEEGGGPVLDAWPVHPILALLRMADHPGDRLARYIVATASQGEAVGFVDWTSDAQADRVSSGVRRRLLQEGYGPVLDRWARVLIPRASPRERVRLGQLVELGYRQDAARPPLRPGAFIRRVEATRMEAPGGARVRVMTIHASKGLEFDAVVLPELESSFRKGGGGRAGPIPVRGEPAGPIQRIFPPVPREFLGLFPEVSQAVLHQGATAFHDELGGLYVALTRARHALHLVVEEGREGKSTPAQLIREGLGVEGAEPLRQEGSVGVLLEEGDPDWADHAGKGTAGVGKGMAGAADREEEDRKEEEREEGRGPDTRSPAPSSLPQGPPAIPMAPVRDRRRFLPRVTPSALEGEGTRTVADLLRMGGGGARLRGSVVHAWLEMVEWVEEDIPEEGALRARGRELGMKEPELTSLLGRFHTWLGEEPLQAVLSRDRFPPGTEVERELPFLHRDGGRILSGSVDRLLRFPGPDRTTERVRVVDFKTDRFSSDAAEAARELEERMALYHPQLQAYRRAMATRFRVPVERVEALLVFLEVGVTRTI